MKKYLIYGLVIVVIVGGLLAVFYFFPGLFNFRGGDKENTNTSSDLNVNTGSQNTNTAPVNLNIAVKTGETEVNKSVVYEGITFKVLSLDKKDDFESSTAGEGQTFIILYLDRITEKTAPEIFPIVRDGIRLKSGNNEYSVKTMNLAGPNAAAYATSYFLFEVEEGKSDFTLNFGTGDSAQTMALGL